MQTFQIFPIVVFDNSGVHPCSAEQR